MSDTVELRRVIMHAVANHGAVDIAKICSKTYLLLRPARQIRNSEICDNVAVLVQVGLLTFEMVQVGEGDMQRLVKQYALTSLGYNWLDNHQNIPA